jgi:hypothetical protein
MPQDRPAREFVGIGSAIVLRLGHPLADHRFLARQLGDFLLDARKLGLVPFSDSTIAIGAFTPFLRSPQIAMVPV